MVVDSSATAAVQGSWARSGLQNVDAVPAITGIDATVARLDLALENAEVFDTPGGVRAFVQELFRNEACTQVRLGVEIKGSVSNDAPPDRDGLEEELTDVLAKHWNARGFTGALEKEPDGDRPLIYSYGLGLAQRHVRDHIQQVLGRRNIAIALLVVALDQLALDEDF